MEILIYTTSEGETAVVTPTPEYLANNTIEDLQNKYAADGISAYLMTKDALPPEDFRNSWKQSNGVINEDLAMVKEMAHTRRRARRDELFKPYDEIIAKQIPGNDAQQAEQARVGIRDSDQLVQQVIDNADTVEDIRAALAAYQA